MKMTMTLGALLSVLFVSSRALAQYGEPPPPPPAAPPPTYAPAPAYAPPPPYQQPQGVVRDGFLIGFSIGGGSISADCDPSVDCTDQGMAASFHIGGMLTPKLGLMLDGSGVSVPLNNSYNIVHAVSTVAIQLWLADRFWLKGGLGAGQFSLTDPNGDRVGESETGAAVLLGAGYELMQGRSFVLDVQGRLAAVRYDLGGGVTETFTNASLSLGFNWY